MYNLKDIQALFLEYKKTEPNNISLLKRSGFCLPILKARLYVKYISGIAPEITAITISLLKNAHYLFTAINKDDTRYHSHCNRIYDVT